MKCRYYKICKDYDENVFCSDTILCGLKANFMTENQRKVYMKKIRSD